MHQRSDQLLDQAFATVPELIRAHARERPAAMALREGDASLPYEALDRLMDRVACALQRDGLDKGDRIAICAASSIPYLVVFLGALRAGVVVVPLSPASSADSLRMMILDSGARLLFGDPEALGRLAAGLADTVPAIDLEGEGLSGFPAWMGSPGPRPVEPELLPGDAFNIIYSSGTTGAPKGIVQPHGMRWGHVRRAAQFGYGPDSVTIASTPLYSNTTLVSVIPALVRGGTVVLMRKFDARGFLVLAERERATHAMLVPVQYRRLMDLPDFDGFDLSSFVMKTCTSAPFAADLKADVLRRWPGGLTEIFGMTEGGGSCLLFCHLHPDKLHTVGRPAPGHDIRIIDESGAEVPQGASGEIVGRSGAMMTGYHNQPQKTADAEWISPQGERFIRTGDVARFDEDGFVILGDRKKDLIISGGFNIYPSDLEAVLLGHPDVKEAAVVGMPSRAWGETPAAFVVRRGSATTGSDELRSWANDRLGKIQRLSHVEFIDELPRSSIGKVLKRELRDRLQGDA
jgi:acyl-CoA synthetase (AMP-forming)/AMP-acid ligase II